jgi:hypothetical protein
MMIGRDRQRDTNSDSNEFPAIGPSALGFHSTLKISA